MTGTQGSTGASEPTDNRRVIRLPRATRLLAAWVVCGAVAFVVVWFSPLGIEHADVTWCDYEGFWKAPWSKLGPDCWIEHAHRFAPPILALLAAALGTVLWVAYLGVRAVRSRVRFKVG